jgi:hypothetical protein
MLDVVATGRLANVLRWYEQEPLWIKTVEIFPKYLIPEGDTLFIKANIVNRENYSVSIYVKILGGELSGSDSLLLYDDGLHFDENPNDNIWGNAKLLSGLEEDIYSVETYMHDFSAGTFYKYYWLNYYTTIGPVVVDNYEIFDQSANFFKLKYDLRNDGSTSMATAVTAEVLKTDTNVTNVTGTLLFGNIAPGQAKSTSSTFPHNIDTQNNPSSIDFIIHIFSNGHFFWSDSLVIVTGIAENETNLPREYALNQNYPNPFNPSTTIAYSIPELSSFTLKVYDVLGSEVVTLVNKEKPVGNYEVEFSAIGGTASGGDAWNLPSGIYFYRLQAADFVETKKMVLMK